MNISGWNYDFETLPHFENRKDGEYTEDMLYESPDGSFCVVNYSVKEVRSGDFRGFLAILKNKETPEKVLNITNINFIKEAPFFASSKPLTAVLAHIYADDIKQYLAITVIIDLQKERFALAPIYPSENRTLYPLSESRGKVFLMHRDGSKRDVTKLTQYPLSKLPMLSGVNIKVNMFNTMQTVPRFSEI